ncbi:MAG: hypothetical protein WCD72_01405 [Dehalococcoidia bacterium]
MIQSAKTQLGIALALFAFAFLMSGVWQIIDIILAVFLLVSFLIIMLFRHSRIAVFLADFSFDNVALFLGFVALAVVLLPRYPIFGIIAILVAYAFISYDVGIKIGTIMKRRSSKTS